MELIFQHVFNSNLMPLEFYVTLLQQLLSNSFLREDNIAEFDHFSRFIILDCALKKKKTIVNYSFSEVSSCYFRYLMDEHEADGSFKLENSSQAIINNIMLQMTWNQIV